MGRVRAVIFDLDGILIDSEPLWQKAETEVFGGLGIDLGPAECAQTKGLRTDEVVAHWYQQRPWNGPDPAAVSDGLIDRMVELVGTSGELLPGVRTAVAEARRRVTRVGLASSSPRRLIAAVLERFDLGPSFDAVCSAEDEPLGKPHPGVYLTAAATLGTEATACLAIEDSLNGLVAAKAARMRCLAVPAAEERDDPRFALADLVLPSLEGLDDAAWSRLRVS